MDGAWSVGRVLPEAEEDEDEDDPVLTIGTPSVAILARQWSLHGAGVDLGAGAGADPGARVGAGEGEVPEAFEAFEGAGPGAGAGAGDGHGPQHGSAT